MTGFIIALLVLIIVAIGMGIRIVPQGYVFVIERLGKYHDTLGPGFHVIIPFVDQVSKKVSLKEQVADFPPQDVITKDNVIMKIDTVVYFKVQDPKLYAYGAERPILALENLTATTLRNLVGELELDQTLTSRDNINARMQGILDEATDPWGIKVNRVELKNILPPKDIRDAMEKQMRAERERREQILRAEGEKRAAILNAEGIKEAQVLKAEGEKQAKILAAEAEREALIKEAEGKSEAILKIKEAEAQGIELVKKAGADKAVLTLKAYEALVETAKGQATKLIIPSEIQGMAGLVSAISETAEKTKNSK